MSSNRTSFSTPSPVPIPILKPALKSSRPCTPHNSNGFPKSESISPIFEDGPEYFRTKADTSGGSSATISTRRYTSKVGFDTFQNSTDAALFSFTLQVKSEEYKRTRSTRSYLVAASGDQSGNHALDWVMESLVQDGDELIVFRGFDGEDRDSKEQEAKRQEAQDLMKLVLEKNDEVEPGRKLSVIVEFVGGKVTSSIERLIALYRPDSLVVGARARSVLQQWGAVLGAPGMGSISRWCVSRSPVPVIVVRPEKERKNMQKRRLDSKRTAIFDGLERPHMPISMMTSKSSTVSPPQTTPRPQTAVSRSPPLISDPSNPLRTTMSR